MKLRETHDLLQYTYQEALGTLKDRIIVDNITYASNSTIDQELLIEENKKLKDQLEKKRLRPRTKGKTLDDVLDH
jgi:hypothetical protein